MKTCKDCRFHIKFDEVIGVCHRFPPNPVNEHTSTQPPVKSAETWCGELEARCMFAWFWSNWSNK